MTNLNQIPERILKSAIDQPASAVQPVAFQEQKISFDELSGVLNRLWHQKNYDLNNAYKAGRSFFGGDSDTQYYDLMESVVNIIFVNIKEQIAKQYTNLEEQQKFKTIISGIQSAISGDIKILKTLNLTIDNDSIIAILSGYVNNISKRIL